MPSPPARQRLRAGAAGKFTGVRPTDNAAKKCQARLRATVKRGKIYLCHQISNSADCIGNGGHVGLLRLGAIMAVFVFACTDAQANVIIACGGYNPKINDHVEWEITSHRDGRKFWRGTLQSFRDQEVLHSHWFALRDTHQQTGEELRSVWAER
jgi:hypothetical protein